MSARLLRAMTERERHVRGKALVEKVHDAAIHALAHLGYDKLTLEDVADAAGVNKTTVYRRWTSKAALMNEALERFGATFPPPPDEGSLRADLVVLLRRHRDALRQPLIRELVRMSTENRHHADIAEVGERLRREGDEGTLRVYQRAVARGELPADTDVRLLRAFATGVISELVFFRSEDCDDARIDRIVDMVIAAGRRK